MTADLIPPSLESAVRAAAAEAPAVPQNLAKVKARARILRRRRTTIRAALAATVVVAIGVSIPVFAAPDRDDLAGPAGRVPLGLWLNRDELPVTKGLPSGLHIPGSDGEIAAQLRMVNGHPTVVPITPANSITVVQDSGPAPEMATFPAGSGPAPLPGGGLAAIGSGPAGRDRNEVIVTDANRHAVALRLMPAQKIIRSRAMPLAGSTTTLYWWSVHLDNSKPYLTAYDIATGATRELTPGADFTGAQNPYFGMSATDTEIIAWPAANAPTCSADIRDGRTGEMVAKLRPAIANCTDVYFTLSPDGKRVAALVTDHNGNTWTQRVITIDARTGKVQKEFKTPALTAGTDRTKLVYGLDWLSNRTIRYARGVLNGATPPIVKAFQAS